MTSMSTHSTPLGHDDHDHDHENGGSPLVASALLLRRVLLAGLFIFSGAVKLGWVLDWGDPEGFASSVRGFRVLHYDFVLLATYVVPWLELVAGGALLLGLFARGAAVLLLSLVVVFIVSMITVLARGIEVDCSCFGGKLQELLPVVGRYLEPGAVDWISVGRNVVLAALIYPIVRLGGGYLTLDRVLGTN